MIGIPGSNYDQWKTATPYSNMTVASECIYCGGDIYEGDPIYFTKEGEVHEDCFHDLALEVLDASKGTGEDILEVEQQAEMERQFEEKRLDN